LIALLALTDLGAVTIAHIDRSYPPYNYMVMDKPANDIDRIFAALADQTRRAILARLTDGDVGVKDICEPFEMSQPAISRHLKVLETAGLITRHRQGTHRMCRLSPDGLGAIEPWLSMIANSYASKYNRLDAVLETLQNQGDT
jgi:DNA-binding transcriptional ArsR family regulator